MIKSILRTFAFRLRQSPASRLFISDVATPSSCVSSLCQDFVEKEYDPAKNAVAARPHHIGVEIVSPKPGRASRSTAKAQVLAKATCALGSSRKKPNELQGKVEESIFTI